MTKDEIYNAVVRAITKVQTLSGKALPPLTKATCPIGDLEGFDSISAAEACMFFSIETGYKIKPLVMLSPDPNKPMQISQIVERISSAIKS